MLEHMPIAAAADFDTFSYSWINVFEKGFRRRDKIRRQTLFSADIKSDHSIRQQDFLIAIWPQIIYNVPLLTRAP
jgi:hypothetical protein